MKFKFKGIDCINCCNKFESELKNLEYIKKLEINFLTKNIYIN